MSKHETDEAGVGRRGFLKLAGLGTVGGAVAAVSLGEPAEAAAPDEAAADGYRESAHVKTYYQSARF